MSNLSANPSIQSRFLALLPRIETHAKIHFRDVHCPGTKADYIAECTAVAWKWFLRLHERGKDISNFPMVFVFYVAKAVRSGRRVCGQEKAGDVLSSRAQHIHGFRTERLSAPASAGHERLGDNSGREHLPDSFEERLSDNTVTSPFEQAMFRIDFGNWLQTLNDRSQQLVKAMGDDERTRELAQRFGVSPGRISQMRRAFEENWERFCGDVAPTENDL